MEKIFKYNEKNAIRTVIGDDGEIWFAGIDVCKQLDYADPDKVIKKLDEDERKLNRLTDGSGQNRKTWTVNEFGLYSLILTSTKPDAKMFKRWVNHQVLPSIRKTGIYSSDRDKAKTIRLQELRKLMENKKASITEAQKVVNEIKAEYKKLEVEFWEIFNTSSDQLKLFPPDEMEKLKVEN